MKTINIIDSPCGSGKTEYAIRNLMKQGKYIYITPYLSEVTRIAKLTGSSVPEEYKGLPKIASVQKLIKEGKNICTTHAMFIQNGDAIMKMLKNQEYILILDEALNVLDPINISEADIENLFVNKRLAMDDNNRVICGEKANSYKGVFDELMRDVKKGQVLCLEENVLMWEYCKEAFEAFKDIWVLTYMFEQSTMCNYLKANGFELNYHHVKDSTPDKPYEEKVFELIDESLPISGQAYQGLINIYEGPLNDIGDSTYFLSSSWYDQNSKNTEDLKRLQNNIYNYIRNVVEGTSKDTMWTTFCNYKEQLKAKGYTKGFVQHSQRATNDFSNKTVLAYAVNKFENPFIEKYYKKAGIETNRELYALSELIQWIFRSAIRKGDSISIYVPSKRMRNLLKAWLNGSFEEQYMKAEGKRAA